MTTILVIGASRGVGLEVVREGLAAGYQVRALARSAAEISLSGSRLEKISASAVDRNALLDAVDGIDAVISVLGIPPTTQEVTLFSQSTSLLVDAMKQAGVKRLIAVTGIGVGDSNGVGGKLFTRFFQPVFLDRIHEDKNREEKIVRESGLDWTIVRPGFLTRWPKTGRYKALTNPNDWRGGFITRGDVADYLVKIVNDEETIGQTPLLIS